MRDSSKQQHTSRFHQSNRLYPTCVLLLGLLAILLAACTLGNGGTSTHHQTLQIDNGNTITYSTNASDVLIRLFHGGGKVGTLEFTPEISLYGNGLFIIGPSLQPQQGTLSNEALQTLLQTLASTDRLLQLHRHSFNDIPDQNADLLQVTLNGKMDQFIYGPFGHMQESNQDMHEYQQLGDAISMLRNTLTHTTQAYTSPQNALLVYQTFREDFTQDQLQTIPRWTLTKMLSLANAAIYECGKVPTDFTSPNADLGCLHYTLPQHAIALDQQQTLLVHNILQNVQQNIFLENGNYYVVMLRPLLPDEIVLQQLAMYGNNIQDYTPVPLQSGPIPVPTETPTA